MIDVVILGAGGTAREVLSWLAEPGDRAPAYRCVGMLDDDDTLQGTQVVSARVVGRIADARQWSTARFVDALGGPRSFRWRSSIVARAGVAHDRFETIVHPAAYVSPTSRLGMGCLVFPHATIGAGVTLGHHVTVLPGAVLNHDAHVGDFTIIASGVSISGNVVIGRSSYLGTACCIIGGISIGDEALIGMGAVVLEDVAAGVTVVGNPARPIAARSPAE
jgi:sugar O-acyltransferase (sialic acid O-acetyltransferase NeuD family)